MSTRPTRKLDSWDLSGPHGTILTVWWHHLDDDGHPTHLTPERTIIHTLHRWQAWEVRSAVADVLADRWDNTRPLPLPPWGARLAETVLTPILWAASRVAAAVAARGGTA